MANERIGFIGLGVMGSAMAANLIKAGYAVGVYNRNPTRTETLLLLGAQATQSPKELAQGADFIFLCVSDGAAVKEIIFGKNGVSSGVREGSVIVDFSTIAPSESKEIAEKLAKKGIGYLDAPVSGGDVGAKEGTLVIMVGGEKADFDRVQPALSVLGKSITLLGPVGSGQMTKAVNQVAVAIGIASMTEAIVLADAAGLDVPKTLEVISQGAAGSWALENYAPRLMRGDLNPGFYAKHMLKDLNIALAEGSQVDAVLPVSGLVRVLFDKLCSSGDGELGNHALIRQYLKEAEKEK